MDLLDLQTRLQNIDLWEILTPILEKNKDVFVELNKQQLIDGQTSKGEGIHPKYNEDPYFPHVTKSGKTITAKGYAAWKSIKQKKGEIPSSSVKSYNTPNLYIKGTFHSNIYAAVNSLGIEIGAQGFGSDFDQKFHDIFGVTEEHLDEALSDKIIDEFIEAIYQYILA